MRSFIVVFFLSILYVTDAFSIPRPHNHGVFKNARGTRNHHDYKYYPLQLQQLQSSIGKRDDNIMSSSSSLVPESLIICRATKKTNDEFWAAQRKLMGDMKDIVDEKEREAKATQKDQYRKQVSSLVSETFYFSVLFFSAIWFVAPNPFTPISYLLGAMLGTAYTYGLGKYVEALGGSAYEAEDVQGSGVGSARFAFLILLFVFVGKFRSEGLQEIPSIMGFFTYQISTLSQGLKDASADE